MRGIWRRQSADQTVISSFFLCPFYLSRHVSFFFFLLQKGYCIATYTYSADWPSQVAISGTEAVIFYPFVTLLTLFFSPLVVAIPPRTDGRMGSPPSQSIDPTCPHVWRIEGLGREGIVQEEVVCFGVCCVCVPATSQPPARPAVWMNNAGAVLSLRVCAQALSPSNPTTATSSCRSINT